MIRRVITVLALAALLILTLVGCSSAPDKVDAQDLSTSASAAQERIVREDAPAVEVTYEQDEPEEHTYVLNTNTHKFHETWCSSVDQMADHNKKYVTWERDKIIGGGYSPCKRCNP